MPRDEPGKTHSPYVGQIGLERNREEARKAELGRNRQHVNKMVDILRDEAPRLAVNIDWQDGDYSLRCNGYLIAESKDHEELRRIVSGAMMLLTL